MVPRELGERMNSVTKNTELSDYMRFTIAQGVYANLNIDAGGRFHDIMFLFEEQDELEFCEDLILEIVSLCDETAD